MKRSSQPELTDDDGERVFYYRLFVRQARRRSRYRHSQWIEPEIRKAFAVRCRVRQVDPGAVPGPLALPGNYMDGADIFPDPDFPGVVVRPQCGGSSVSTCRPAGRPAFAGYEQSRRDRQSSRELGEVARIQRVTKALFPAFRALEHMGRWEGTVQLRLHETGFDTPIPATRISDGTLRFIAMLAVLLSPEPPPLVCIEEPELGLHPDAVALMAEVLAEASERMQLVVTTHSDTLVSALTNRPSAIIACERPGDGTILRRLDPERLAHWLDDDYGLGDLWRMGALGANP